MYEGQSQYRGLQVLQEALQHDTVQAEAVEPVLAMSLEHDGLNARGHITSGSRDLLRMLQLAAGVAWPKFLQPGTAARLTEALLHEPEQSEIIEMYDARVAAEQVSPHLVHELWTHNCSSLSAGVCLEHDRTTLQPGGVQRRC